MHVNHHVHVHVLCVCWVGGARSRVCVAVRSTEYENVEGEKGNTHGYSVCGGLGGARRGPVWSTCAVRPETFLAPPPRIMDVAVLHVVHLCDACELNENGIKLAVPGGLS